MTDTADPGPQPLGGGAMLRQARENAGVHVAALAVALKVPVRQLEALEQDRFDLLPDHTFARALAGSVCRHLKIDPAPILAVLPQGGPRAVDVHSGINEPFRTSSAPGASSLRERLLRPPALAALVLLLGALVLVVLPELRSDAPATPQAPQTEAPAAAPPAPAASGGVVVEPVTPLPAPSVPAAAPASAPASAAAPVPASAMPVPVPVPASPQPATPAARQP